MGLTLELGDVSSIITASPQVLEETSPAVLTAAAGYLNGQTAAKSQASPNAAP